VLTEMNLNGKKTMLLDFLLFHHQSTGPFLALVRRKRPSEAPVRGGERGRRRFNGFRFCALPLAFFYDVGARPSA
jgi:hypothetical protein